MPRLRSACHSSLIQQLMVFDPPATIDAKLQMLNRDDMEEVLKGALAAHKIGVLNKWPKR